MAASTNRHFPLAGPANADAPSQHRFATGDSLSSRLRAHLAGTGRQGPVSTNTSQKASAASIVTPLKIVGVHERRRRRRVPLQPMYTSAIVRILAQRENPIEGSVLDLSENGMAIDLDRLVPVGQAVAIEFRIAGLGAVRDGEWAEYTAVGEVLRHDDVDDFPGGPYRTAIRFGRIATMTQAQIARFVATQPD